MTHVLGNQSEYPSKNNPVQTTPVPVQLLEVLLTVTGLLVIIADQ